MCLATTGAHPIVGYLPIMNTRTRDLSFRSELTPERIEYAYGRCVRAQQNGEQWFADVGWKAAQRRDEKLLVALERMAEITYSLQTQQLLATMSSAGATFGETRGTTEHQLCREAYRLCSEGRPIQNFMWIYGAAAWLCGYIA